MYTLKQLPEDFIVKEIPKLNITESGRYLYLQITKQNKNTLDVVKQLAKILHILEKDIGFAGNKDKNAITEQVFSVKGVGKEKIATVEISDVKIECLGFGNVPITLGDLEGNQFEITIRNIERETLKPATYIPNYFDEQRFSQHNVAIGRCLLHKDFAGALGLVDSSASIQHLTTHQNDFVGALKLLPMRLLKMYINAYQSYLWNETLAQYLREDGQVEKEEKYSVGTFVFVEDPEKYISLEIPLIGCGNCICQDEKINVIVDKIMQRENITRDDFIIRQIKELTQMGEMRKAFVEVKQLQIGEEQEDELNVYQKKRKISFILGKGSYATMAIRAIVEG